MKASFAPFGSARQSRPNLAFQEFYYDSRELCFDSPLEVGQAVPWALQELTWNFALREPSQEGLRHRPRPGVLVEEVLDCRLRPVETQTPFGSRLEQTHVLLEAFSLALPQPGELQRVLHDLELLKEQGASQV